MPEGDIQQPQQTQISTPEELDRNAFEGQFVKFNPNEEKVLKLRFVEQFREDEMLSREGKRIPERHGLLFNVLEEDGKPPVIKERVLRTTSKPLCRKLVPIIAKHGGKQGTEIKVKVIHNGAQQSTKIDYFVAEVA
jgi:hypothetical protein